MKDTLCNHRHSNAYLLSIGDCDHEHRTIRSRRQIRSRHRSAARVTRDERYTETAYASAGSTRIVDLIHPQQRVVVGECSADWHGRRRDLVEAPWPDGDAARDVVRVTSG